MDPSVHNWGAGRARGEGLQIHRSISKISAGLDTTLRAGLQQLQLLRLGVSLQAGMRKEERSSRSLHEVLLCGPGFGGSTECPAAR